MVSLSKIVGVMSCGFLLCLGLANVVQAEHTPAPSDVMKTDRQDDRQGFQSDDDKQKNVNEEKGNTRANDAKSVKGELFRIEAANYFIKQPDGKELRVHAVRPWRNLKYEARL